MLRSSVLKCKSSIFGKEVQKGYQVGANYAVLVVVELNAEQCCLDLI